MLYSYLIKYISTFIYFSLPLIVTNIANIDIILLSQADRILRNKCYNVQCKIT